MKQKEELELAIRLISQALDGKVRFTPRMTTALKNNLEGTLCALRWAADEGNNSALTDLLKKLHVAIDGETGAEEVAFAT